MVWVTWHNRVMHRSSCPSWLPFSPALLSTSVWNTTVDAFARVCVSVCEWMTFACRWSYRAISAALCQSVTCVPASKALLVSHWGLILLILRSWRRDRAHMTAAFFADSAVVICLNDQVRVTCFFPKICDYKVECNVVSRPCSSECWSVVNWSDMHVHK